MRPSLKPGLSSTARYEVDDSRVMSFMGSELGTYSTPNMLRDIERTCRTLALAHLDEGEDSVGAHVTLDHLGPTLKGMWVEVSATLIEMDGRRITFEASVRDAVQEVGRARHVRFVVDKARQKARLEAKAAKLAAASAARA
jgi:fluoroacetyl-CoA thioesterase